MNAADTSERQTFITPGNANARGNREQQFVVFAAVQRVLEAGAREYRGRSDFRGNTRSQAHAVQIERQAIAQIHGRCSAKPPAQIPAEFEPWFGLQVPLPRWIILGAQSQSRPAQRS